MSLLDGVGLHKAFGPWTARGWRSPPVSSWR
jgi:hypothetical protein